VLALVPLTQGRAGAKELVGAVFVLVVVLTVIQGGTLPHLAKALRLTGQVQPHELEIDSAALDQVNAGLLQVRVQPGSQLHGVYLNELRLPVGAVVSLVVRDNASFTPDSRTRIAEGDQLLVVTTEEVRDATERRIRAVDRAGRYARWKGEAGA
jgi:cell volume regulation protein A